MKIIQSSSLRFQEGNSDKVYETDLVELSKRENERYLVNFRYGRYGQNLREGSKTPIAVSLSKAETVFNSLIVSKINKGYVLVSGFDPLKEEGGQSLSTSVPTIGIPSLGADKNALHAKRQAQTHQNFLKFVSISKKKSKYYKRCNRAIWRLGELKATDAVPDLIKAIETKSSHENHFIRNYSICWALGQCGDERAIPALTGLLDSPARLMAHHALYHLTPEEQQDAFLEACKAELNSDIVKIVFKEKAEEKIASKLLKRLEKTADSKKKAKGHFKWINGENKENSALEQAGSEVLNLYLLSKKDERLRKIILALTKQARFEFGQVWIMRQLFKIAEFERDAVLLGLIIKRIEDSAPDSDFDWERYQQGYGNTYSTNTRNYLRRRTWRLLRRLGQLDDPAYVPIAKAVLLHYNDKDGEEGEATFYSYDEDWNGIATTYYFHPFARDLAYNQILFRNSKQFELMPSNNAWHKVSKEKDNSRTEAFRDLWDAQPEAFVDCLKGSECEAVQGFGLQALSEKKDYCRQIKPEDWAGVFKVNYLDTATFAKGYIEELHQTSLAEINFLQSLFVAKTQMAREYIQSYIPKIAATTLLADIGWHQDLIVSDYEDNRTASDGYHALYAGHEDKQQILLGKLVAWMQSLKGDREEVIVLAEAQEDGDRGALAQENADILARNESLNAKIDHVSWTVLNPLESQVKSVGFDVLRDLVLHPLAQVQKLGGKILVLQKHKPTDIPDDMFTALITSDDPELRALAVELLSNMSDEELATMDGLLVSLLLNDDAPVRDEARAIIKRIAPSHKAFSDKVLEALIPHCFAAEKSEGIHDTLVACISEDLEISWSNIDKNQLWRLLQAHSKAAQRVGEAILMVRPSRDYSVRQWARLGKHSGKKVRQWTQTAYEENHDIIVADFSNALRLLDTDWDDSRTFALIYFREKFDAKQWSPDHLILLCDSVRPDVQKLGRDLLRQSFKEEDGEQYLLKLSQHPARNVQLFASEFLQSYAGGKADVITKLNPYFIAVLSSMNQGKVAKERVLSFLLSESEKSEDIAKQVSEILARQSVTVAIMDKGKFIKAMLTLKAQYPGLILPFSDTKPLIRGFNAQTSEQGAAV